MAPCFCLIPRLERKSLCGGGLALMDLFHHLKAFEGSFSKCFGEVLPSPRVAPLEEVVAALKELVNEEMPKTPRGRERLGSMSQRGIKTRSLFLTRSHQGTNEPLSPRSQHSQEDEAQFVEVLEMSLNDITSCLLTVDKMVEGELSESYMVIATLMTKLCDQTKENHEAFNYFISLSSTQEYESLLFEKHSKTVIKYLLLDREREQFEAFLKLISFKFVIQYAKKIVSQESKESTLRHPSPLKHGRFRLQRSRSVSTN